MIRQLRRRMTLMVIAVLILVSAGIVLAIHLANERSIAVQAESTLSVLAENSGSRPADTGRRGDMPAMKPDESDVGRGARMNRGKKDFRGEPPALRGGSESDAAGLSNSYDSPVRDKGSHLPRDGTVLPP